MSSNDQEKSEQHTFIAFCPHCGNQAPQRIVYEHEFQSEWYLPNGQKDEELGPGCEAYLCICSTCNDVLLYSGIEVGVTGQWPRMVYPTDPQLHDSVPENIRTFYAEAASVKAQSPYAFAVMIRRSLEAVCIDRGIKKKTLSSQLATLAERGDIPPTLATMTTMLRKIGNAGAHATDQPVTVPMAWAMDEFFRAIIEYVYVAPSKIDAFEKRLVRASESNGPDE